MPQTASPTAAELRILQVLWRHGPATVRAVHERIAEIEPLSYTTILKQLQIMTEKGLVARDTAERAHIYKPLKSRGETERELLGDFMNRVYDGSASRLVLQALGLSRPASDEELDEIDSLIERLRQRQDRPD